MSTFESGSSTALAVQPHDDNSSRSIAAFSSQGQFATAQRMAQALAASTIVPTAYRASLANCLVALEIASRTGASVLMVMQNLNIIDGRPSWSATFLIASVNSCGRFSPLRYELEGTPAKAGWRCRAYATDLQSRDVLLGEWITWEMVNAEGWYTRRGSKWPSMPGQMIRYRAASFWTRTYAPEISLGMYTSDEAAEIPAAREMRSGGTAQSLEAALAAVVTDEAAVALADEAVQPTDEELHREALALVARDARGIA